MRLHVHKKGFRALGISESFVKGISEESILAGVVMRADMIVDGFTFSRATVGGMDATEKIIEMYRELKRNDISAIMLNGCIISWFNIIDITGVYEKLERKIPVICVTYEPSEGLEEHIKKHFRGEDCEIRIEAYKKLGSRIPIELRTGHEILVRNIGISEKETVILLNKFTIHGKIPEPLRVAKIMARSILNSALVSF